MSDAFEEAKEVEIKDVQPDQANALEALVGEGKKFSDAESLAKGKLEADNFYKKVWTFNAIILAAGISLAVFAKEEDRKRK